MRIGVFVLGALHGPSSLTRVGSVAPHVVDARQSIFVENRTERGLARRCKNDVAVELVIRVVDVETEALAERDKVGA